MMDEISLHYKISELQSKMLKFHKKVSPKKSQGSDSDVPESKEENSVVCACTTVALGLLKISLCIMGPTLFPAIVFCFEGASPLFWQVTVVSSIIALILAFTAVSIMYVNAKKVACGIQNAFAPIQSIFSKDGIFRFQSEIMASDVLKTNAHDILYLLFLIFMCSLLSLMSYIKNIQTVFYFSLASAGFVSGILSTIIYNLLNSPDLLPFHTPRKIEMNVTAPTPGAKRKLDFIPSKASETSLEFRFPVPNNNYSKVQNVTITGSDRLAKSNISKIPLPSSQEKGGNTLELPINFSTFFRRLSF